MLNLQKPARDSRKRAKAKQARRKAKARRVCWEFVWAREQGICERCHLPTLRDAPEWHPDLAQVNEKVPRSRGGDPTDAENCELTHQKCHMPNGEHAPTLERMQRLQSLRRKKVA